MKDSEGRTPLHYAAGYNHRQIARLLLSENAPLEVGPPTAPCRRASKQHLPPA